MGESVESLAAALNDDDEAVRTAAAGALKNAAVGPQHVAAVPALVEALEQEDVCQIAAWALGEIGAAAKESIEALVECLERERRRDCSDSVEQIWEALLEMATADNSAAVAALHALDYEDGVPILEILYEQGPAALTQAFLAVGKRDFIGIVYWLCQNDAEMLVAIYRDEDVRAKGIDSYILTTIDELVWERKFSLKQETRNAAQTLFAALERDDDDTRREAAKIIDNMGGEIRDMVPAELRQYLNPGYE